METAAPDVGTMYKVPTRMVELCLTQAAVRRPARGTRDERRNYDRITSQGRRVARAEVRRLTALMRAVRLGGLVIKKPK